MPLFIQDPTLSRYWKGLEKSHARNPNVRVTNDNLLDLLASITHEPGRFSSQVKQDLKNAGTPEAELKIVQNNLGPYDKADIARILDTPESQTVPLDPSVRNFLAAVIGREPLDVNGNGGGGNNDHGPGPLAGDGDLKVSTNFNGGIDLVAKPNQVIAAMNMSTAATDRLHVDDIVDYLVLGNAGPDGKLHSDLIGQLQNTHEGDYIRFGAHDPNSDQITWLTVQADGLGLQDTTNAQLALFRIGASFDQATNSISLVNMNEGREISEPNALVYFKNKTTGQGTVVKLDANGDFPKDTHIPGKAGDTFDVSVSDGINNKDFSAITGQLQVPGGDNGGGGGGGVHVIPEPALDHAELDAHGNPLYQEMDFKGPLFLADSPKAIEVKQGQLGDCYCPSGFAAMAHIIETTGGDIAGLGNVLKNAIVKNDDGTYTAHFKQKNWQTGKYEDVVIGPMSDKLYVRPNQGPLYGAGGNIPLGPDDEQNMVIWFPLLEKAYACWKGSYDAIGNGGSSAQVFQDVLGIDALENEIQDSAAGGQQLFQWVKHALDNKLPASLGTYGDSEKQRYTGSGIYPDHSYSVLGYAEKDGVQWIKMRNPWGEITPPGDPNDPDNGTFLDNGIFWIEASKAAHFYETFFSVVDPQ